MDLEKFKPCVVCQTLQDCKKDCLLCQKCFEFESKMQKKYLVETVKSFVTEAESRGHGQKVLIRQIVEMLKILDEFETDNE